MRLVLVIQNLESKIQTRDDGLDNEPASLDWAVYLNSARDRPRDRQHRFYFHSRRQITGRFAISRAPDRSGFGHDHADPAPAFFVVDHGIDSSTGFVPETRDHRSRAHPH